MNTSLYAWHQLIQERNFKNIASLLADEVAMHSPIVHTPVAGKAVVTLYLTAAFYTFLNDEFKYVRQLSDDNTAILEFTTIIDGIFVNGVDMIIWNSEGKITDFKVMVRPLKAVNLIHKKMEAMLESLK